MITKQETIHNSTTVPKLTIMSTCMQQNNGSILRHLNIFNHPLQIESIFGLVIVSILLHFESARLEDFDMIPPRRIWNVNGMVGPIFCQKSPSQGTCSRSTERLDGRDVIVKLE
jgi:hypothetical protein